MFLHTVCLRHSILIGALVVSSRVAAQDRPVRLDLGKPPTSAPIRAVDLAQADADPLVQIEGMQAVHPDRLSAPETLPVPLPEASTAPLSLAELESMALSCNPSVARAAALVQAARGNWVQVGLKPNPNVGYEGQQLGSGGLAEQHGVFAEQEFIRGGKLRLNREVAAQELARAERELGAQQQRVITDVRIAFYSVLVAQEQEHLAAELVQIGENSLSIAEQLFKAQEVGRTDVLQARIEIENARIVAVNARNRRASAWQSLSAVVGHPRLPPQSLRGDPTDNLPRFDFGTTLERLLTTSPEIAASIADVERSRWALERARVDAVPNVTVQGVLNVVDNGIGGKPDANLTVGVPLPLWNKNQGGIARAAGEVAAAQRSVEQLELELQNRLAAVYERYGNAQNQVDRYSAVILPAAKESYDLVRQSYEAGQIGYVTLLTAQRTYSQTRLSYLESLRELRTTAAQLEGFLLFDSLQSR